MDSRRVRHQRAPSTGRCCYPFGMSIDTDTVLARLADADPDVRYDACKALAGPAELDAIVVQALLAALEDSGYGTEWVNHGAGTEPDYFPVAHAAARALSAHADAHRPALEEAFRAGSVRLRAALAPIVRGREPRGAP